MWPPTFIPEAIPPWRNCKRIVMMACCCFNATVLTTVMYGCQSRTMTKDMTMTLKRTQRRMLRLIINAPRRRLATANNTEQPDETQSTDDVNSNPSHDFDLENLIQISEQELLKPWPEFIKRTTHRAEELAKQYNIDDWTTHYLRQKWRWAARIAKQAHNRWSWLISFWEPQAHDMRPCGRPGSRPRTRWDDDINHFLQYSPDAQQQHTTNDDPTTTSTAHWLNLASHTALWNELEEKFITYTSQTSTTMPTTTNTTKSTRSS